MTDPLRPAELATPGPLRDTLVAAILRGEKTATSTLLAEFEADGEPLPFVGERFAVLDSDGHVVATIETTAVDIVALGDADEALARDEGEGFTGVAEWRAAHEDFWEREVRPAVPAAFPLTDATPIVVERFRLVAS